MPLLDYTGVEVQAWAPRAPAEIEGADEDAASDARGIMQSHRCNRRRVRASPGVSLASLLLPTKLLVTRPRILQFTLFVLLLLMLPALALVFRPCLLSRRLPSCDRLQHHPHQRIRGLIVRAMGSVPTDFSQPRQVVKKVLSQAQPEGDGATVRRSIGRPELKQLDPFLLLDYFEASGPAGFPDHPHRGFETVTYMLQGSFTHEDFVGHKGILEAGDVQWMTAGRGIVHSEMPSPVGVQKGLQLWVNLAGKDKMIEPNYQELKAQDIPRATKDGVEVVIIAGESCGIKSPVFTRTPTMYLDFYLQPGASVHQAIPEGWNAFTFVLEGSVVFGKEEAGAISASHTVVLSNGDGLSAWNKGSQPAQFVLVAGKPLNEPVVQYGPFVMNTQTQVMEAVRDYQLGKNGFEGAHSWTSQAKANSRSTR